MQKCRAGYNLGCCLLIFLLTGCVRVDLEDTGPYHRSRASRPRSEYTPRLTPGTLILLPGTRIRVRLKEMLDSDTAHAGQRFTATVLDDVRTEKGVVAIPANSIVHGYVADVKHIVNRTSMRLCFDQADLPDGRRVALDAEPPNESKIDLDELSRKGAEEAGKFLVQKGIDAATGGILFPVWIYMRAQKVYGFVTKESRLILPAGCVLTIELNRSAFIPPTQ